MLNMSQRRAFDRAGAKSIESEIDRAVASVKAQAEKERAEAKQAAAEREATRQRFTREDLQDATHARDRYGRWRITRHNQKTLTVDGDFGPRKIAYDRVLDHRTITEP